MVSISLALRWCLIIVVAAPLLCNLPRAPEATLPLQIMSVGMIVDAFGRTSVAF